MVKLECVGGPRDGEIGPRGPKEWCYPAVSLAQLQEAHAGGPVTWKGVYRIEKRPDGTEYYQWHPTDDGVP